MSFTNAINYMRVLRPDYPATVLKAFTTWAEREKLRLDHPMWGRLTPGGSVYCQHEYNGDEQIFNQTKDYDKHRKGHRYTVINYAYNRTGTVECRLLPMMDTVEQAISAIRELVDTTNAFLVATAAKEAKMKAVIEPGHAVKEVKEIFI